MTITPVELAGCDWSVGRKPLYDRAVAAEARAAELESELTARTAEHPKAPTCSGWPPCGDRNCERCDAMHRETYGTAETDVEDLLDTLTTSLGSASDGDCSDGMAALRKLRARLTAETDEQAAERELGAWLVAHPGWTWAQIRLHGDYEVCLRYGVETVWGGWQSTRAAAIHAALAKAKGGEGG